MKIYCPNCGSPNNYTSKKPNFCQNCGKPFGETKADTSMPTPQRSPGIVAQEDHEADEDYGIEEVPHPIGAIIFHSGGIAGALGIGLFSLFPLLILHQLNYNSKNTKPTLIDNNDIPNKTELDSDDWELATEEELSSGEFESH